MSRNMGQSRLRSERIKRQEEEKRRKARQQAAKKQRQKKKRKRSTESAVYIIGDGGRFLKIGYTKTAVKDRLKSIQTGYPLPLKILYKIEKPQANKLEAFVHAVLHEYRRCGEWFECPLDVAIAALDAGATVKRGATWDDWHRKAVECGAPVQIVRSWEGRKSAGIRANKAMKRDKDWVPLGS